MKAAPLPQPAQALGIGRLALAVIVDSAKKVKYEGPPEDTAMSTDSQNEARDFDATFGWRLGFAVLLALLTAAVYANAAHGVFINDDKFLVVKSVSLTPGAILKMFRENAWAASGVSSDLYRPMLTLLLAIEGHLHGGGERWFHLTNIALHIATTLLLYRLLALLLGDAFAALLPAFLAALIFGVHPIHTEAVDSVFNRSEILATLGVVGAMWVVLRWGASHPASAWLGAAVIYLFALLCRESAAPLPALVLLVLVFHRPELLRTAAGRRRLWPALSMLAVAAVYLLLRRVALTPTPESLAALQALGKSASPTGAQLALPSSGQVFLMHLGMALCFLREGLRLLVFPHPLHAFYHSLGAGGPGHALAMHVLILGSALLCWRSAPGFLLGLSFFYLALLPSTRIVMGSASAAMAERYLYLPSVGLSLALALLLRSWTAERGKWLAPALLGLGLGAVVVVFGGLTMQRNADWSSEIALWQAEARVAPESADSWQRLASAYLEANRKSEASDICDQQLSRHLAAAKLQTVCAVVYDNLGRMRDAEAAYKQAIQLRLGAAAHANLARFYDRMGRRQEAERAYLEAVRTEVNPAHQHYRRAQYLLRFYPERQDEARLELQRALEIQPRFLAASTALRGLSQP